MLLVLLTRLGRAALARLRGMFAFCLWDRKERTALLARDPYGIKPLYLKQSIEGNLLFASEVRTILASGLVKRRLNVDALAAFLAYGSVPEPLTMVRGVDSLPAGHIAVWANGKLSLERFWCPPFVRADAISPHEATEYCRQALERSVQAHLLSDGPLGLFLSGGLDSAAVLALARVALKLSQLVSQASHDGRPGPLNWLANSVASTLAYRLMLFRQLNSFGFLAAIDQPTVDGSLMRFGFGESAGSQSSSKRPWW